MHDSMFKKLDQLENRINEIQDLLLDSETVKDIEKYTLLNKEFSDLKPIVDKFNEYNQITKSIEDAKTDKEIYSYLKLKYGDWILYKTPFNLRTIFLWLLPIIIILIGMKLILRRTKFE